MKIEEISRTPEINYSDSIELIQYEIRYLNLYSYNILDLLFCLNSFSNFHSVFGLHIDYFFGKEFLKMIFHAASLFLLLAVPLFKHDMKK